MNATARMIAVITIAEPRSPCASVVRPAKPARRMSGFKLRRTSDRSSLRRTSRSAAKITRASLRNSDGCIVKLPTAIHARASLIVTPSPGVNGASMPAPAITSSGTDSLRSHVRLTRRAMIRPTVPSRPTSAGG